MSDEERQRQMDFILTAQAQFAVGLEQMRERQAQSEARIDRVERVVKLIVRAGVRARRDVRALVAAQTVTNKQMAETDERINALIGAVERHVTETHGAQG